MSWRERRSARAAPPPHGAQARPQPLQRASSRVSEAPPPYPGHEAAPLPSPRAPTPAVPATPGTAAAGLAHPPSPTAPPVRTPQAAPPVSPLPPILRLPQLVMVLGDDDGSTPTVEVSGDVLAYHATLFANLLADVPRAPGQVPRVPLGRRFAPAQWWAVLAYVHGVHAPEPTAETAVWLHTVADFLQPAEGEGGAALRRLMHRCMDALRPLDVRAALRAFDAALAQHNAVLGAALAHRLSQALQDEALQEAAPATLAALMRQPSWRQRRQAAQLFALRWLTHACPIPSARVRFLHQHGLVDAFSRGWREADAPARQAILGAALAAESDSLPPLPAPASTYLDRPLTLAHLWTLGNAPLVDAVLCADEVVTADAVGRLRVYEVASGRCLRTLEGLAGRPLALFADDAVAVACDRRAGLAAWDVASAQLRWQRQPTLPAIGCAHLGSQAAVFGCDDGSLWQVDYADAPPKCLLSARRRRPTCVVASATMVVVAQAHGGWLALDRTDGLQLARGRCAGSPSALALADGNLYLGTDRGEILAWTLDQQAPRWRCTALAGAAIHQLHVVGNQLVVPTREGLVVLGCGEGAVVARHPAEQGVRPYRVIGGDGFVIAASGGPGHHALARLESPPTFDP